MTDTRADTTAYFCKVCGYSPTNRASWCDLGCGRDYNEMIGVPQRHLDGLLADAAEWEETARVRYEAMDKWRVRAVAAEARVAQLETALRMAVDLWRQRRYNSGPEREWLDAARAALAASAPEQRHPREGRAVLDAPAKEQT